MKIMKNRRARRSDDILENDLFSALSECVKKDGFSNISTNKVIANANVSSNVFYHRYHNIDALVSAFVSKYEHWLLSTASITADSRDHMADHLGEMLVKIENRLSRDEILQKLLVWEQESANDTTEKTFNNREKDHQQILDLLDKTEFVDDVDIEVALSLLFGGLYYIILTKKQKGTLFNVDFSSRVGKKRLEETLQSVLKLLLK